MYKLPFIFTAFIFSAACAAQSDELKQLNKDIWQPFLLGVNSNKAELYNQMNAKKFLWVSAGKKTRIMDAAEYKADAITVMQQREQKKTGTTIDVRFTERHVNGNFAAETYIMKVIYAEQGKEPVIGYGWGQNFSRKENSGWKKMVQYSMNKSATEQEYLAASALE